MMSSQKDGMLVANFEKDLRESAEKTISEAAKRMVSGKMEIEMINYGGNEYFLSYAPLETVQWYFGVILSLISSFVKAMMR